MQAMGAQSPLVMAKLGFDLRSAYDELLRSPLPEHLRRLIERLPGRVRYRRRSTEPRFELPEGDASLV